MDVNPGFEHPMCLATLKSSDRTKQSVCGWQYIYIYIYIYITSSDMTLNNGMMRLLSFGECGVLLHCPGPLWLGGVVPDRFLSIDQIELFDI